MKTSEIIERVNEMSSRTQFGLHIVAKKSLNDELTKPKHNPYYNRVERVHIVSNVTFADYQNKVNGQAQKHDADAMPFTAKGNWFHHLPENHPLHNIVVEHNTTFAQYLTYTFVRGQIKYSDEVLLLDGRIANDSEKADILAACRPKKTYDNKGQVQSGLTGEKQVDYRTLALDNAIAICFDGETAEESLNAYLATTQLASEQVPTRTSGKATATA